MVIEFQFLDSNLEKDAVSGMILPAFSSCYSSLLGEWEGHVGTTAGDGPGAVRRWGEYSVDPLSSIHPAVRGFRR